MEYNYIRIYRYHNCDLYTIFIGKHNFVLFLLQSYSKLFKTCCVLIVPSCSKLLLLLLLFLQKIAIENGIFVRFHNPTCQ